MKRLFLFFTLMAVAFAVNAQKSASTEFPELRKREDSLKRYALDILRAETPERRFEADSIFTKMFVRALQVKNSFSYPFDSLVTISKLTPPDSSFRIFTWQLVITDNFVRQKGAIQMRTKDGMLKLFPLIDMSDYMESVADTITDNYSWFGAVYYDIIPREKDGQNIYTLLGYDENNVLTNKKVIELLSFENGKPVFGAKDFSFSDKSKGKQARYIIEYKKHAGPRLAYDKEEGLIVVEHLISETGEPQRKETYVGDGDYDGFKWEDGRWVYIDKIFDYVTPEGKEPVPVPLRDTKGNIDRSRLKTDFFEYQNKDSIPAKKGEKRKNSGR